MVVGLNPLQYEGLVSAFPHMTLARKKDDLDSKERNQYTIYTEYISMTTQCALKTPLFINEFQHLQMRWVSETPQTWQLPCCRLVCLSVSSVASRDHFFCTQPHWVLGSDTWFSHWKNLKFQQHVENNEPKYLKHLMTNTAICSWFPQWYTQLLNTNAIHLTENVVDLWAFWSKIR